MVWCGGVPFAVMLKVNRCLCVGSFRNQDRFESVLWMHGRCMCGYTYVYMEGSNKNIVLFDVHRYTKPFVVGWRHRKIVLI